MAFTKPPELILRSARHLLSGIQSINTSGGSKFTAAVCTEYGKPLQIKEVERKQLNENEVRVSVKFVGLNFADILGVKGQYQVKQPVPFVPGSELSGEILEVGANVKHVKVGDHVVALAGVGALAQECNLQAQNVVPVGQSLDLSLPASALISYGTAWMALKRRADIKPGETVLVTAAAGGVGLAVVDLAANVYKCKVIGACGGPEKCEVVKQKGAFATIDYNKENVRDGLKRILGKEGPNIVVDNVGGKLFLDCMKSLAHEGRIVVVGFAGGDIPKIPANIALLKSCAVLGVWWGNYATVAPSVFKESVFTVIKLLQQGKITPHISARFPLAQVNEGMTFITERKSTGKVLVEIG